MEMNIKLKNKRNIILTCQKLLAKPLYYSDPSEPKTENLDKDDIIILSLTPEDIEILTFNPEIEGDLIYFF